MMSKEYILAIITAVASIISSIAAIKIIIAHEAKMCDKRMEAFKEGLKFNETRD